MNTDISIEYCRQKAAPTGASFYYCTLYSPANIKRNLYSLHAFSSELDELLTDCSDPGIAHRKLVWWTEEIQRLIDGQARHPVTRELALIHERFPEMISMMIQLIRHYERQIDMEQPENYQDLLNFLQQGPGLLWMLSAKVCQARESVTPGIISNLGCQFAWFRILQNTYDNSVKNRRYWPINELADTQTGKEFYEFQVNRLIEELNTAIEEISPADRSTQLHALTMAQIIKKTCIEIARSGYQMDQEKISLTPLRKLWIAWLTKRKYK